MFEDHDEVWQLVYRCVKVSFAQVGNTAPAGQMEPGRFKAGHSGDWTDGGTYTETDKQTDRQTNRQTEKTDRWTDSQSANQDI